jgi:hypothetical protein
VNASIQLIDGLVGAFEKHVDAWHRERVDAAQCLDIENTIRTGVWLFDNVREVYSRLRGAAGAEGETKTANQDERMLTKNEILEYERLCKSFKHCEQTIASARAQGLEVDNAEQFLGCMRDAEHAIHKWRHEQDKAMKLRAEWLRAQGLPEEEIADLCDPEKHPGDMLEEEENLRAAQTITQMPGARELWARHAAANVPS